MKQFLVLCLLTSQSLFAQVLDSSTDSEHFRISSTKTDASISHELLLDIEQMYSNLSKSFHHTLKKKLQINIYPNLGSHHEALGLTDAPDWLVASTNIHSIDIVSPLNPGPIHSQKSIERILLLSIAKAFIYDQFGEKCAPFWLVFGIAANKAEYIPSTPPNLATIEKLENAADFNEFGSIGGYACAYSLASYIETHYGWEKVLQLLENYKDLEKILGTSKDQLYSDWKASLQS